MHYNLVNEYMGAKMSVTKPEVGMGATLFVGSDRYPMVITKVFTDKKIEVVHLDDVDYQNNIHTNPTNGIDFISENRLNYYKTLSGNIYTYRKNYRWIESGKDAWGTGAIHLGKADYYLDPSF